MSDGESPRENRRQYVHLGNTAWIVTLHWLEHHHAVWLACAAVALNWIVLPLTGLDRRWFRRKDGPFIDGAKLYPVAVLAALLIFDLPTAAAAWAVMGVGDCLSNLMGRRFGRPPFLGRQDRSAVGTASFFLSATPAAALAHGWVSRAGVAVGPLLTASCAAAAAGALVELLPLPRWLDDNVPITLAAGAVFAALI